MNRSTKRYISMKLTEYKLCKKDIIDLLEYEYHEMTSNLHEIINKWESKKKEIEFIKDLKYDPRRKVNKGV